MTSIENTSELVEGFAQAIRTHQPLPPVDIAVCQDRRNVLLVDSMMELDRAGWFPKAVVVSFHCNKNTRILIWD